MKFNKDWYAVVQTQDTDSMFRVRGPIKDGEHWTDELPGRLQGAEVLGVSKQRGDLGAND